MTLTQLAPIVAIVAVAAFNLYYTSASGKTVVGRWVFPALLSAAFALFTAVTIASEGVGTVWPNHTSNLWGNQVWFDLLLAVSIGLYLLVPRAKALGIQPWPWVLLTLVTGCIGLLAFLAYVLYVTERPGQPTSRESGNRA